MFKNMKIGARLGLGFALVLILLAVIAFVGITRMQSVKGNLDTVVTENNVKIAAANDMRGHLNVVARSVRNMVIYKKAEDKTAQQQRVVDARKKYDELNDKLGKLLQTEAAKKSWPILRPGALPPAPS